MSTIRIATGALLLLGSAFCGPLSADAADSTCGVVRSGARVALIAPDFRFTVDTSDGLRAVSWENRRTGQTLALSQGPELAIELGDASWKPQPLTLRVVSSSATTTAAPTPSSAQPASPSSSAATQSDAASDAKRPATATEARFELADADDRIRVIVVYRFGPDEPILHKSVELVNRSGRELRLLNLRLGCYRITPTPVCGEQGFPAYVGDAFFLSLAHPAGWATLEDGAMVLRQYPGRKIASGGRFTSIEAVYGVGRAGEARTEFVRHVKSRMRRVLRHHDKPLAIFEPFGARPGNNNFDETEEFLLANLAKVAQGQRDTGLRWDYYSIDFWVDFHGDLKRFDPQRFPNGLAKIKAELDKLGTSPGLWIDSSMTHWSIGGNPAVQPTFNHDPKQPSPDVPTMCRATEPIRSMYVEAFRHHIRNGVRLLKFDNLHSTCNNPNHDHLPGLYATEAIQNAVIEFFGLLDRQCPDVFLMLYWGHRSPWWLLHADTLFDAGLSIEAASPADQPAPFARDAVTQRLDQSQWHAKDVPPLGKESLGVWLSDWGWNSQVGKERWQEGFVMDLCRGNMMAQPWSDTAWLSPAERTQMAELVALLRARPECFGNPRLVLGSPWKNEPYGYCCSDGRHAMLALSNCAWRDARVTLLLDRRWGLSDGVRWDVYRRYPNPAQWAGSVASFGGEVSLAMRPFEVTLLEVVPHGERPAVDRSWSKQPIPTAFVEPTQSLPLAIGSKDPAAPKDAAAWTLLQPQSAQSVAGTPLKLLGDASILAGGKAATDDTYRVVAKSGLRGITGFRLEAMPDSSLPGKGPGRAQNGNFALDEFRVVAAPASAPQAAVGLKFRRAMADFSQSNHGGWPIEAAIDGKPHTAWAVDPYEGLPHTAVFELERPLDPTGDVELRFELKHTQPNHTLGRFRLSATTHARPLPAPAPCRPTHVRLSGRVPATHSGGLLVVAAEMARDKTPVPVANVGEHFNHRGSLRGASAPWKPVLGKQTYPAPWQAWRVEVTPSDAPGDFELRVDSSMPNSLQWTWRAWFVPQ